MANIIGRVFKEKAILFLQWITILWIWKQSFCFCKLVFLQERKLIRSIAINNHERINLMTWQHGYRWAINDVLQVHILSQHGMGWGLPLSAGSLPSFYFPIKTKHPINLIHLSILLEGRRLEVCLVEKKKKNYHCWWTQMGSQKLMTVTVTDDYRLHLPCRTSPWMASLPVQSVCFPSAHRKEVSREEWRLLAAWEGPGPRWDLCVS